MPDRQGIRPQEGCPTWPYARGTASAESDIDLLVVGGDIYAE